MIWKDFLSMPEFISDSPETSDKQCWLCGGEIEISGWKVKEAIGNSFTDHNIAAAPHSASVCGSCAALTSKAAWVFACEKHDHDPYFPTKDNKKPFLANWMFSSHVFSNEGWLRPSRVDVRDILLNPPEPPFVITIAETGKKHVIFRAKVNYDKSEFVVNLDENQITVNHKMFVSMLNIVEDAYSRGISKESMLTGNYNLAACMSVGVNEWMKIDEQIKRYRNLDFKILKLAIFVSIRKEVEQKAKAKSISDNKKSADPQQLSLF